LGRPDYVRNVSELCDVLSQQLDLEAFYSQYVTGYPPQNGKKTVLCPFHHDTSPSLQINDNGSFKCYSGVCGVGGRGPYAFLSKMFHGEQLYNVLRELHLKQIKKYKWVPEEGFMQSMRDSLQRNGKLMDELEEKRGISRQVVDTMGLGWSSQHNMLSIPIYNRFGFPINVMYLNSLRKREKPHSFFQEENQQPTSKLWPPCNLEQDRIVLFEGQADTLCAISLGIPAMTIGSSSYVLSGLDLTYLKGKEVTLCYDRDDPGKKAARRVADQLLGQPDHGMVRILGLVHNDAAHTDFTDWIVKEKRTGDHFAQLVATTEEAKLSARVVRQERLAVQVRRAEAGVETEKEENLEPEVEFAAIAEGRVKPREPWRCEAQVISATSKIYEVPIEFRLDCTTHEVGTTRRNCENCYMNTEDHSCIYPLDMHVGEAVQFFFRNEATNKIWLKDKLGLKGSCRFRMTRTKGLEVRICTLASLVDYRRRKPDEGGGGGKNPPTQEAVVLARNLRLNVPYQIRGFKIDHPKDSSVWAYVHTLTPLEDTLDEFAVTSETQALLQPLYFQATTTLFDEILNFYDDVAKSVTFIKGRRLEHMAVDLVFHSPVSFRFNQELVRKAPLDVLMLGDTRCGKNGIAETLQQYYGVGAMLNAENVSYMNLVSGIKTMGNYRFVSWGQFVAQHRSTLVVDELTGLSSHDFAQLSGIRHNGIASINKFGENMVADAITGVVWLSNPQKRAVSEYDTGVDALIELVPKEEDRSRFDYVVCVKKGEVSGEEINVLRKEVFAPRFSDHQNNTLLTWIKSRRVDQIEFTGECMEYIVGVVVDLSEKFHPSAGLVQVENLRIKIAKIAAAIAGRIYSTDPTGEKLVVSTRCAKAAVKLLLEIYTKTALGYNDYSKRVKRFEDIDTDHVIYLLKELAQESGTPYRALCGMLLSMSNLSPQDVDLVTNIGQRGAGGAFLKNLYIVNCLTKSLRGYRIMPGFRALLKTEKEENDGRNPTEG